MDWTWAHSLYPATSRIPRCSEPSPRHHPRRREGQAENETPELTDLLTIKILSFKPEISQIGKIRLSTTELDPVLHN